MIDYTKPKKIVYVKKTKTLEPIVVNGVRVLRRGESVTLRPVRAQG